MAAEAWAVFLGYFSSNDDALIRVGLRAQHHYARRA